MVSDLSMGAKMNGSSINYVIFSLKRHLILPHSTDFLILSKKRDKNKRSENGSAIGGQLEQKQAEKACAAMSYLLFKKAGSESIPHGITPF